MGMRKQSARLEMLRALVPVQELPAGACCAVHIGNKLVTTQSRSAHGALDPASEYQVQADAWCDIHMYWQHLCAESQPV